MKKFLVLSIMLAFGFACLISGDAFALDKDLHKYNMLQCKGDNKVYAEITPYVWWATPDDGIHLEDGDIQFTLGVNASVKKGKWGYYGDAFYMRSDMTYNNGTTYATFEVDEWIFTNAATFYLYKADRTWLELMAGVRTWNITTDTFDDEEIWNEPFVGLRWQWEFSQRWYSDYIANYGGFDVDNAEDAYEIGANLGFRINKKSSVKLGYKFISTDYDHDGFKLKNEQDGLYVGYSRFF